MALFQTRRVSLASITNVIQRIFYIIVKRKFQNAQLVRGWVTMTDQGLSRIHGFSAKVPRRVTLVDE